MTLMDLLMNLNDERVSILAATKWRSCKVHVSCPGFVFVQFQRYHRYVSVNVIYKPFVYLPGPRLPCRCTDSQRQHQLVRPSTNAQAFLQRYEVAEAEENGERTRNVNRLTRHWHGHIQAHDLDDGLDATWKPLNTFKKDPGGSWQLYHHRRLKGLRLRSILITGHLAVAALNLPSVMKRITSSTIMDLPIARYAKISTIFHCVASWIFGYNSSWWDLHPNARIAIQDSAGCFASMATSLTDKQPVVEMMNGWDPSLCGFLRPDVVWFG